MCGRFAINVNVDEVVQAFQVEKVIHKFTPNYNVAPTHDVPVILEQDGKVVLDTRRWGLIPHWAKDKNIGYKMINARAETVAQKPSFQNAFAKRRCIVVASGFFEWKRVGSTKMPYFIHPKKEKVLAMAGLWEKWQDLQTCTILTTEANSVVSKIHDRMPVLLKKKDAASWIDMDNDAMDVTKYLKPSSPSLIAMYPVSDKMNSVKNNTPNCIKKIPQQTLC